MKKIIIGICSILSIGVIIISVLYWQLFGYSRCINPSQIRITTVNVSDRIINISGTTISSALKYQGYRCEYKDNILYIGLKYSLFFGENGSFSITEKLPNNNISKVIIKNKNNETEYLITQ